MSLLRAFLLAQAIAATTKKHFKTSLSTLMDNAMQEDEALLKDKKEGDKKEEETTFDTEFVKVDQATLFELILVRTTGAMA